MFLLHNYHNYYSSLNISYTFAYYMHYRLYFYILEVFIRKKESTSWRQDWIKLKIPERKLVASIPFLVQTIQSCRRKRNINYTRSSGSNGWIKTKLRDPGSRWSLAIVRRLRPSSIVCFFRSAKRVTEWNIHSPLKSLWLTNNRWKDRRNAIDKRRGPPSANTSLRLQQMYSRPDKSDGFIGGGR